MAVFPRGDAPVEEWTALALWTCETIGLSWSHCPSAALVQWGHTSGKGRKGRKGTYNGDQWGLHLPMCCVIQFGEVTSAESGLQGAQLTHFAEGVNGCKWIDVNGGFRRSMHVAEWWMVQPGALPNDQNVGRLARFVLAPCSRRWRITGCLVREPRTQPLKDMMTWELLKRLRWSVSNTCTNSIQKLGAKAF